MIELEQMKRLKSNTKKHICMVLAGIIIALSAYPSALAADTVKTGTNYPFIFVSGYAGWGDYERFNSVLPYWGRLNGDLMKYLNGQGYKCCAASVNPVGSAWDRACELYAQLNGTVVDYGAVHSRTYKHIRFGRDFSKEPLISGWGKIDENNNLNKVNFVAHSFGGATVRLLAELMANGSKEEMAGTTGQISGLFTGGKTEWIYSISTFASPHNGTDSVLIFSPLEMLTAFDSFKMLDALGKKPLIGDVYSSVKSFSILQIKDTGLYDLFVDGAAELNDKIKIVDRIYYFSFPNDGTVSSPSSDKRVPDKYAADPLLWANIYLIGRGTIVTRKGIAVDRTWYNNDGVVNTISSTAPKNEPQKPFDAENIEPGIWHIMETFRGDHAAIIGGLSYAVDINNLYLNQLKLINSL